MATHSSILVWKSHGQRSLAATVHGVTKELDWGFPGGSEVKVSACNVGDPGSIPGLGRSPGEGNGNPLQYSCLENPMEGGAWQATVHGVAKSQTRLSYFTLTFFRTKQQQQYLPNITYEFSAYEFLCAFLKFNFCDMFLSSPRQIYLLPSMGSCITLYITHYYLLISIPHEKQHLLHSVIIIF